jgi:glycosyltransferase involved in cell wall biosynthesis
MHCPTINELPASPEGKSGWPWIEESFQSKDSMIIGSRWPRISIVTPNLNQANYLEETIRSVLLQGYPNLEYIIIDGGSTDSSIEIIKQYENWLTYWTSESDNGQSHAINKGFTKASGNIYAYINSDDIYEPEALKSIAIEYLYKGCPQLLAGECIIIKEQLIERSFKPWWPSNLSYFIKKTFSSTFAQPSSFWGKESYLKIGGFDESYQFCFDREFFLRMGLIGIKPIFIPKVISRFREHVNSKTVSQSVRFHKESIRILEKHFKACGVSSCEKEKWKKKILNEILYHNIYAKWKIEGRKKAISAFFKMIIETPSLITERKILGQARQLLSFKEKNVRELILLNGQ